jgi:hypothetical protein
MKGYSYPAGFRAISYQLPINIYPIKSFLNFTKYTYHYETYAKHFTCNLFIFHGQL